MRGETGVMIGTLDYKCVSVPFEDTFSQHRPVPSHLLDLMQLMTS